MAAARPASPPPIIITGDLGFGGNGDFGGLIVVWRDDWGLKRSSWGLGERRAVVVDGSGGGQVMSFICLSS